MKLCFGFKVFLKCEGRRRRRRLHIEFYSRCRKVKGPVQLKVNMKLPVSIKAADEFGNAVEGGFDEQPSWESSDESVASLAVAEDGLSAEVISPEGVLGSATIQVSGLVAGKAVLGSLKVDMIPGDVASIKIEAGEPVDNGFDPEPKE